MRHALTLGTLTAVCLCSGHLSGAQTGSARRIAALRTPKQGGQGVPFLPPDRLPLTYIQSGFTTNDPPAWFYKTVELKTLRSEAISLFFDGSEVLNLNVDTTAGRRDVRDLASAMRRTSDANGRQFFGFWSFPRLPGFFRPEDVAAQPETFRASSLKADGSLWRRIPSLPEENESKIKFTGEYLDLANETAVRELLRNVARVFRASGPPDESVGPLPGYIVLNEWLLSSNYESVWSKHEKEHDVASPDTVIRLGRKTHRELFTDNDPHYSYLNPPKRAVPLYSRMACASFAAFAAERGLSYDRLPADREEFNDDDATVTLPAWVCFVDGADTQYWSTWEEWVYDRWTTFVERLCEQWAMAQQEDPLYRGVLYFQLPMWYSLRESSREPLTYRFADSDGVVGEETVTMAQHAEYDRLNPVVMGTDMDRLLRCPWLAGMLHETTKSIHLRPPGALDQAGHDAFVQAHDRFRHYFLAQGALAKRACRANGKLFGAFARAQFFKGHSHLDPEAFSRAFSSTIDILGPDVIATIGPWFVDKDRLDPRFLPVARGGSGELQDVWVECCRAYRERYAAVRR